MEVCYNFLLECNTHSYLDFFKCTEKGSLCIRYIAQVHILLLTYVSVRLFLQMKIENK